MSDFVKRIIGNLDKHQKLVSTMQIFFQENLSLTDAAVALKVHRNTLIYRLDRIAELTGLDPRNFLDALHLYTALLLRRMQREVLD
jgi:carbohydrate diacid regulator